MPDNSPWSFGQSTERSSKIWQKGLDGKSIPNKAVRGKNAMDTTQSIDRALTRAMEKPKSSLGMSVKEENTRWRTGPEANNPHIDEDMVRNRKHVFRAYADVKGGEDFTISVGPELILKDDQVRNNAASASEPDSALGLGMKFQYDF